MGAGQRRGRQAGGRQTLALQREAGGLPSAEPALTVDQAQDHGHGAVEDGGQGAQAADPPGSLQVGHLAQHQLAGGEDEDHDPHRVEAVLLRGARDLRAAGGCEAGRRRQASASGGGGGAHRRQGRAWQAVQRPPARPARRCCRTHPAGLVCNVLHRHSGGDGVGQREENQVDDLADRHPGRGAASQDVGHGVVVCGGWGGVGWGRVREGVGWASGQAGSGKLRARARARERSRRAAAARAPRCLPHSQRACSTSLTW